MPTECSAGQLEFEALGSRRVTASFDGGAITSNAGALLLRQTDRMIGLSRQAAACFSDGRDQDQVEHSLETLVAQRVHGIALGYEDLNDHDELRHDPVLGLISGKLEARRSDCAVLAGKSTLNRLEHLAKGANPRFIVTSLTGEEVKAQELYEKIYCARGEMENRIKECQLRMHTPLTISRSATVRLLPPRLAGGISGPITAHSSSVRSLG